MNLEQLRTFREVAIRGGFGRAAQELYLTQSAVSMQIAALERELGTRLFERLGRHIALTHAGHVFLGYATHVVSLIDEASRAMADIRGAGVAGLAVGASPTIGNYVAPSILGRFKAEHPGIRLALEIAPTSRIVQRLADGALDVGLVEGVVTVPGLSQRPFLGDELALVVPPGHRWSKRDAVDPQELSAEPFIAHEPGSDARRILEDRLAQLGVEVRPALEIASPEAVKAAVRAGLGVAIVSSRSIQVELSAGALHAVPLRDVQLERSFQIVLHGDRPVSPTLEAFLLLAERRGAPQPVGAWCAPAPAALPERSATGFGRRSAAAGPEREASAGAERPSTG